ncbi:MAG: hypothetical protein RPU73_12650, partial [Candidatus Sedimenticola sp. (ex Thyasira tokunagai)]
SSLPWPVIFLFISTEEVHASSVTSFLKLRLLYPWKTVASRADIFPFLLWGTSEQVMTDCHALRRRNICVENLANSQLSAAIFALILRLLSTIQFGQTYSGTP